MEINDVLKISVEVSLKELTDLEDRSIRTVEKITTGETLKLFTIENVSIVKKHSFSSSKEDPIKAEATLVFNTRCSVISTEVNALLKKLLKIKM